MVSAPELKSYLDKKVSVQLNGSRTVTGTLRGYDVFMNITMADALEHDPKGEQLALGTIVVRGNSIVSVEALEKI
ncbi:putative small nuclear ribonucleo protein G (snRNP-G) [Metschnikowia bicuspidata var. bicuspidata NRRL YB-4993]|uniref:Small nuclear ribonucleoprotein G n=1 Tax=Metschnikowia bicuspidata var. bicuspidata NRRL YB-4993 TaxID=869754 RepID=A0A1A0H7D2_9ASCO|nr:putative small nuclear ribonucleo protein G (snRNP-G) [Metschnikowia bicuspidata var. bicuspidata NRRL YB-4993]OBA20004.1 putative small nuclear ribonucleo protein G (snRNP-G) [Metschnikowia bicuspidata var. bicuspidata NRRL YB-4993]